MSAPVTMRTASEGHYYSYQGHELGPYSTLDENDVTFDDQLAAKFGVVGKQILAARLPHSAQLHVSETISTGEVATQLKRKFTFATTDDDGAHQMYYYKDGVYLPNASAIVASTVQEAFEAIGLHDQPTSHFLAEVAGHLERGTYVNRRMFDKDEHILNVKNGLLYMQTGELRPHSPSYLSRKQIPVAYNPTAKCPKIDKFLEEVQPDEGNRTAIIEHASVPLLKSNFLQKAFMYVGGGRNGKSIWFMIVNKVYGAENITHNSLHDLQWNRFAPASLDGKYCNIHDDISTQEIRNTGIVKQLISGDPIMVEHKGRNRFSMEGPHPIMFFAANQLPEVEDASDAWMRRWEYLQWEQTFDAKADKTEGADRLIGEKIATPEELEGLLVKLIEAARRIKQNQRLTCESTIDQVREEWIKRSDVVLAFFQATIESDPDSFIPKNTLQAKYVEYCKNRNYSSKSVQTLWKKLRDNYPVHDYNPLVRGQQIRCWKGIKLAGTINTQGTLLSQ